MSQRKKISVEWFHTFFSTAMHTKPKETQQLKKKTINLKLNQIFKKKKVQSHAIIFQRTPGLR